MVTAGRRRQGADDENPDVHSHSADRRVRARADAGLGGAEPQPLEPSACPHGAAAEGSPSVNAAAAVGGAVHNGHVPRPTGPLVGRADELGSLVGAISAAQSGSSSAVIVGGDAGVGKPRWLGELLGSAAAQGVLCLIGHCVDLGDTPPPYLPFTEAFTRLTAERPELGDDLVTRFPALARLLPGRTAEAKIPVERGELFDSVLASLTHLATAQPVALIVEDVHWADQATRDLLGFLFTRLAGVRMVVIASYRSDDLHRRHPMRRTLAEWSRLPAVTRVFLDPLAAEDVRDLVRAMYPTGMAESDVDNIVRRADGNAFFAEELMAAAEQCGAGAQLPWQLADLLLVRLDRL